MKIALLAAALAAAASASAGLAPSSANSVRNVPPEPAEPTFNIDLRVRNARGGVRSDLLSPTIAGGGQLSFESPNLRDVRPPAGRPWLSPNPKPITPQGDGEFPAIHYAPKPDVRFPAQMPIAKGEFIDPKMPMKMPDPAIDYKLHVREVPLPTSAPVK